MSVVDYTSSLVMGPDISGVNDKYAVLGCDDVVTISFSGVITKTSDAVVATVPAVLRANISNIFFAAFEHTPNKAGAGGRITSSGEIIINNSLANASYWIAVTYVRRT